MGLFSSKPKMIANAAEFVAEKLALSNTVIVFSKSYWPHGSFLIITPPHPIPKMGETLKLAPPPRFISSAASACKSLLQKMNIPALEIIELDQLGEPRNGPVQQVLQKRTGDITVPQVFYNDEFIGNNETLQNLHKKGELAPKLGL